MREAIVGFIDDQHRSGTKTRMEHGTSTPKHRGAVRLDLADTVGLEKIGLEKNGIIDRAGLVIDPRCPAL